MDGGFVDKTFLTLAKSNVKWKNSFNANDIQL